MLLGLCPQTRIRSRPKLGAQLTPKGQAISDAWRWSWVTSVVRARTAAQDGLVSASPTLGSDPGPARLLLSLPPRAPSSRKLALIGRNVAVSHKACLTPRPRAWAFRLLGSASGAGEWSFWRAERGGTWGPDHSSLVPVSPESPWAFQASRRRDQPACPSEQSEH